MRNERKPFYIIDKNYEVIAVYYGYEELHQNCYHAIKNGVIGNSFSRTREGQVDVWSSWTSYTSPICQFIIHDSEGYVVRVQSVMATFESLGLKEVYRSYRKPTQTWEFRKDPVPYTRCRRWRCRNYRKQKFISELKDHLGYKEYARPGRLQELKYIAAWYYDEYQSDIFNKHSWKKNKKRKQWM